MGAKESLSTDKLLSNSNFKGVLSLDTQIKIISLLQTPPPPKKKRTHIMVMNLEHSSWTPEG